MPPCPLKLHLSLELLKIPPPAKHHVELVGSVRVGNVNAPLFDQIGKYAYVALNIPQSSREADVKHEDAHFCGVCQSVAGTCQMH